MKAPYSEEHDHELQSLEAELRLNYTAKRLARIGGMLTEFEECTERIKTLEMRVAAHRRAAAAATDSTTPGGREE